MRLELQQVGALMAFLFLFWGELCAKCVCVCMMCVCVFYFRGG